MQSWQALYNNTSLLHCMWFISVLVIYISSECICNLYLATLWYLMKHSKARTMIGNSQSSVELFYQREKKVFKVIVSVIFVYFFCVIPWLVTQFVLYFCKVCHEHFEVMMVCYNVTTGFLFVNSALNPFLYSWRFSKFRATFKYFWRTFSQLKGRRKKTIKITERRQSFNTQLWKWFVVLISDLFEFAKCTFKLFVIISVTGDSKVYTIW